MTEFNPFAELEKLLGHSESGPAANLPANSRYRTVPVQSITLPDGTDLVCFKRRFVPLPESLPTQWSFTTEQGDRLDRMATKTLGDPELYWRLCDASGALNPTELEEEGRTVRVPYPEGIPAPQTAN